MASVLIQIQPLGVKIKYKTMRSVKLFFVLKQIRCTFKIKSSFIWYEVYTHHVDSDLKLAL